MTKSRNSIVSSRYGKSSNKVARMQGGNLARPIGTKAAKRRDSLDALRQERQLEKQETAKAMIEVMKDIRKSIDKTADNIELTSKKIHIGAIFQTSSRMIDQHFSMGAKQQAESLLVSCRVHMTSEVEYEPREMGKRIFTYAKIMQKKWISVSIAVILRASFRRCLRGNLGT
jgi:hypothetical protein